MNKELITDTKIAACIKSTTTKYSDKFYYFKNDIIIGQSLELYGEYCQPEIDMLAQLLTADSVVYDIGANLGTHTRAFATMARQVVAFEPNSLFAHMLRKNTVDLTNVIVLEQAASDTNHMVQIEQFDPNVPGNYGERHTGLGESVPANSIDNLLTIEALHRNPYAFTDIEEDLPQHNILPPTLIKIDVEGYELQVIQGAADTIQRYKPAVFFEAHGKDVREIVQRFEAWGYNLYWFPCKNYNPNNYKENANNVFGEGGVTNIIAVYKREIKGLTPCTSEQIKDQPMNAQNQVQVDIDYIRTTRVHIAIPCYGGMMTESTAMSLIKWANTCRELNIHWTIETLVNESLINRARNTMTAKFLHMPEATHLFFIDADIGWEPWHLLVLLNHRVDLIGGLYPLKTLPLRWCVNGVENGEEHGPLKEVSKTGTGFMLIARNVFEKMKSHPAVKSYKNDIGLEPVYDQYLRTYFDTAVRQNRLYSEDWTFCENWRDIGGKVWVDTRVTLRHTGTFMFANEIDKQLEESYSNRNIGERLKQGWTIKDSEGNDLVLPPVKA